MLHDDTLRAELTIQARLTHSEQLMPHIADMLDKASVKKSQIDGVAVAVGPGSFTGLRIGAATAKGLGLALKKPLIHVPTVDALAYNMWGASGLICLLWMPDDVRSTQACTILKTEWRFLWSSSHGYGGNWQRS